MPSAVGKYVIMITHYIVEGENAAPFLSYSVPHLLVDSFIHLFIKAKTWCWGFLSIC